MTCTCEKPTGVPCPVHQTNEEGEMTIDNGEGVEQRCTVCGHAWGHHIFGHTGTTCAAGTCRCVEFGRAPSSGGFLVSHPAVGPVMLRDATLRDWFAGQALTWLDQTSNPDDPLTGIGADCYKIADAMMKARGQ